MRRLTDEIKSKPCTACNVDKPFSEYSPVALGKFGLAPACKICTCERQKKWQLKHNPVIPKRRESFDNAICQQFLGVKSSIDARSRYILN